MPRTAPDYAPFRALLSAPYPLPAFIRRPRLTAPDRYMSGSYDIPLIDPVTRSAISQGFPYDPDWRNRPPAILPNPYPKRTPEEEADAKQRKEKRLRLKREKRMMDRELSIIAPGPGMARQMIMRESGQLETLQSPSLAHQEVDSHVALESLLRAQPTSGDPLTPPRALSRAPCTGPQQPSEQYDWNHTPTSTILATPEDSLDKADLSITDLFVNHLCTHEEKQALEALEALTGTGTAGDGSDQLSRCRQTRNRCRSVATPPGNGSVELSINKHDTTLLLSPATHRRLREVLGLPALPDEPYYSPMAIDPHSSEGRAPSWPHPLPPRETVSSGFTVRLGSISLPSTPSVLIAKPEASAVSGLARGLVLPSAPPSRSLIMPAAKACHNFLLARRVQASQKKAVRDHNRAIFALAQRTGGKLAFVPDISTPQRIQQTPALEPLVLAPLLQLNMELTRQISSQLLLSTASTVPPNLIVNPIDATASSGHESQDPFNTAYRCVNHGRAESSSPPANHPLRLKRRRDSPAADATSDSPVSKRIRE